MIHRIYSDLASFKALDLHQGLNVIVAEKARGATERQTRNGAGKTSFVELVHFLLGADCGKQSIFRTEALAASTFGMTLDLCGAPTTIERSGAKPSRIVVRDGQVETWSERPSLDRQLGHLVTTNPAWRRVLGQAMFDLAPASGGDEDGPSTNGPTFRSLFSYFARRQMAGGFARPDQHSSKQQAWDHQVAITYLLGLDWSIPQRLQHVRERERTLHELRKATTKGTIGQALGTSAALRTQLAVADAQVKKLRDQLTTFRVLPQYRELEQEANELTVKSRTLADENTLDGELVEGLRHSLAEEAPPAFADVRRVYDEAGVVLPGVALKRFEDVKRFHDSIVQNRRSHLQGEVRSAEDRINKRHTEMKKLDDRRAELMTILRSHGALDQFMRLQSELNRLEARAAALRQRLIAAEQLESTRADVKIERSVIEKRLQDDLHEQRQVLDEAILAFEDLSNALYEKAGSLTLTPTPNGPAVSITIDAARSKGITNMQIFCFDMMLMQLCSKRGLGPGFLIHDSHLFDGVDERQVAKALQLGAERADQLGFQYIVTMNSDALPRSLGEGFLGKHALPVELTDRTEDGGLFGLRFN